MTKAEKRAAAVQALQADGAPKEIASLLTLFGDMLDSLERIAVALEKPAPAVLPAEPMTAVVGPVSPSVVLSVTPAEIASGGTAGVSAALAALSQLRQ